MIRLALPNKGRMHPEAMRLLKKIGLDVPDNGRKLFANTSNPEIQVVFARAADIPLYVARGVADLGITGEDMLAESGAKVEKLLKLKFGSCRIAVAAPVHSRIKGPSDYGPGLRVAAKLTNTAAAYFKAKGVDAEIVRLSGALELAPALGVADVIVDQVSTGTTLEANNLRIVDVIAASDVYLVGNPESARTKKAGVDEVRLSLESVITAEDKRYVMANVMSDGALERVLSVMPSMESPTVLNLAKKGEYAVHTVVDARDLISTISRLKSAGARDILVMNVSRLVE